jgi:hypothetical protein
MVSSEAWLNPNSATCSTDHSGLLNKRNLTISTGMF